MATITSNVNLNFYSEGILQGISNFRSFTITEQNSSELVLESTHSRDSSIGLKLTLNGDFQQNGGTIEALTYESNGATIEIEGLDAQLTLPLASNFNLLAHLTNETLASLNGQDTVNGSNTHDVLRGYSGSDVIFGNDGMDRIFGGKDTVDGADAGDTIHGGGGADEIFGNAGNDLLYADGLSQIEHDGKDVIYGGKGADTIYGGGGLGNKLVGGGNNADPLDAGDVIYHGNGGDNIYGNGGDDTIYAGATDLVYGGIGNDIIDNSDGGAMVHGQAGNDTIHSSSGTVIYYETTPWDGGDDVITGFDVGGKIRITDALLEASDYDSLQEFIESAQVIDGSTVLALFTGYDNGEITITLKDYTDFSAQDIHYVPAVD